VGIARPAAANGLRPPGRAGGPVGPSRSSACRGRTCRFARCGAARRQHPASRLYRRV